MHYGSNLALEYPTDTAQSVTAQALRKWCVPERILAITDFAEEDKLLYHAIRQARPAGAKVLLVHPLQCGSAPDSGRSKSRRAGNAASAASARAALDRMARQLRWVGIACEPILLKGKPAEVISTLAKDRGVDRILMNVEGERDGKPVLLQLAEELLPGLSIPLCILGRRIPQGPQSEASTGQITLALSLRSRCDVPLAFASRLAQEQRASLTVIHVFDRDDRDLRETDRTAANIASKLPSPALTEAELLCPVQIVIREGDAAAEIVKYVNAARQDFLVLCPQLVHSSGSAGALSRIVSGAQCPVILLGGSVTRSERDWPRLVEHPAPPNGYHG